jgi:hypothetical protein
MQGPAFAGPCIQNGHTEVGSESNRRARAALPGARPGGCASLGDFCSRSLGDNVEAQDSGSQRSVQPAPPMTRRVLSIVHNPRIPRRGKKLNTAMGWNDPDDLAARFIDDVRDCSHGRALYQITERIEVDGFPRKADGFAYTPESYLRGMRGKGFHQPDAVDYHELLREFEILGRIRGNEIDEVWLFGFPYAGYYESIMGGPGAFWCNAPPLEGTQMAERRFVIMGFNYERGVGEMLEDLGHRAESILTRVFAGTGEDDLFERFTRYDARNPGEAEVGTVHYAPNSQRDYDWGNRLKVLSRCDAWYDFPGLAGEPRLVDSAEWGGGDIRLHHMWWFRHFPHYLGSSGASLNDWWGYVLDPDLVDG